MYLSDWEKSVDSRGTYTPAEKNKMLLSQQTRSGLRITGIA